MSHLIQGKEQLQLFYFTLIFSDVYVIFILHECCVLCVTVGGIK
jgi:hypothetical protein